MARPENPEIFVQPAEVVRLHFHESDAAAAEPTALDKIYALARLHAPLGIMVVLPTLLAIVYFGLIAAPRYESEAKFVVRGPSTQSMGEIASMVEGSQIVRSADDSYVVIQYMLSRDAMRQMEKDDGLLDVINRPEADFLWRYPGWLWSANEEHLFKHYLRFISVTYDATTGICTLDVQAFRPQDAQKIADALVRHAEALVNELNARAEKDAIETATREVAAAKIRARAELEKVTAFRDREQMIDPTKVSTEALETIGKLSLEESETGAQLAEMMKSSPNSPQISTLRLRIAALDDQIDKERKQLAGTDGSMAPLIAEYERLDLERGFADKTFISALNLLESAQVDALRQRLYLDRVSSPTVPDYAQYPYRLTFIVVILLLSYMLYRIARALVLDIVAHAAL